MRRISITLLALAAASTSACTPLQLGLAAASALTNGGSSQPAIASTPRADIMSALAGLDSSISPACQAKADALGDDGQDPSPSAPVHTTGQCDIQYVCLPGSPSPVEMMACVEPAGADPGAAAATLASGSPAESLWPWQLSDVREKVAADD